MQLLPGVPVEDHVVEGPREPQHGLREQSLPHLRGHLSPRLVEGVELDVEVVVVTGALAAATPELGEPALHKLHHVRPSLVVDAHPLHRAREGQRTQQGAALQGKPGQPGAPGEDNLAAAHVADLHHLQGGAVQLDHGGVLLAAQLCRLAHAFDRLHPGHVEVGEEGLGTHQRGDVCPALGRRASAVPGEREVSEVDGQLEDPGLEGARVGVEGEGGELREPLQKAVVDLVFHKVERSQEELGVVDLVVHLQRL